MTRYARVWCELLVMSWHRIPLLTAVLMTLYALSVVTVAAAATTLRVAIDAMARDDLHRAVLAVVGCAVTYAVTMGLAVSTENLKVLCVERVGLTDLQERIHRDIASLQGLEHLERTDFLDRLTLVLGSAWALMASLWTTVGSLATFLQLAVSLALLGSVSPWLLFLLAFAALPVWFDHRGQRAINRTETDTAGAYRLQRQLFELAVGAGSSKEIRVAGAAEELTLLQADAWNDAMDHRVHARLVAAVWKLGGWGLFTAGFVAGLVIVVRQAASGQGSVGDVVLAITVATTMRTTVYQAAKSAAETADAGRLIDPFLWLRDYVETTRSRSAGEVPAPSALREGIRLSHVSYTYPGTDRKALDDVSIDLPAGSVVAIVGEYGSGKSTLVKILAKLYRWDTGSITVDGSELEQLDTTAWHSRCSVAFQDFGRFQTVFREVVGFGDLPHMDDRERVSRAVAAAEADAIVAKLPNGLDTQLGQTLGGVDLSEGQWQKTALARASMRAAPLLVVLDEPTASLDAPSEQQIFEKHMQHARSVGGSVGAITIVVSHRFSTVTRADVILVLNQGRLVEAGSHAELLARGGQYAQLYGIQSAAYAPTGP
ncbi:MULTISPECIES: ABC transporter ATP-binding protein [unclassified Streptomyces]|uniref:ABC transporter ATP-binding protein n=1 Tax=unclassified Streptomyces TaxID=2593676 RepID=UPI0033A9AC8E